MSSDPNASASSGVSPVSATQPVNPEPSSQSDPAFVPSPHQQEPSAEQPWQSAEFKKKVVAAGFPGSPQTDDAWLAALYKFGGDAAPPAPVGTEPQNPS